MRNFDKVGEGGEVVAQISLGSSQLRCCSSSPFFDFSY